jgi:hypothetical protein
VTLAERQRRLAALLAGEADAAGEDAHLRALAGSEELAVLRWSVTSWRVLNVERRCPLIAALLRLEGRLEPAVERFAADQEASAFRDELGPAFLRFVAVADPDPLARALAALEAALIRRLAGTDGEDVEIPWPQDPRPVLAALVAGRRPARGGGPCTAIVDGAPPSGFRVS